MHWVDTVILADSIAAIIMLQLMVHGIRKKKKILSEWVLLFLFLFQTGWIVFDALGVVFAFYYGSISATLHGINGLSIIGMVFSTYLFIEVYPEGVLRPAARLRAGVVLIFTSPLFFAVFTPAWIANRRIENGIKLGDPGPFLHYMVGWTLGIVVLVLYLLIRKHSSIADRRIKANLKLLATGIATNLIISLVVSYLLPILEVPSLDFFGPIASLIFVSLIIYTISFHRLFDFQAAAVSTIVRLFVAMCFGASLFFAASLVLNENLSLLIWFLFTLLFLSGNYLDRTIESIVERFFHQKKAKPEYLLLNFLSNRVFDLRAPSLGNLLQKILETLTGTVPSKRALILALDSGGKFNSASFGQTKIIYDGLPLRLLKRLSSRILPERFAIVLDGFYLMEDTAQEEWPHNINRIKKFSDKYPRIAAQLFTFLDGLNERGIVLFAPLILNRQICGFVLLGEKANGQPYYLADLKLLNGVRKTLALSIRNFTYHEELKVLKGRADEEVARLTDYFVGREPVEKIIHGKTLVYSSKPMADVVEQCEVAAKAVNSPVLISGETGTGKELIARIIHEKANADRPFVPVNCAAIPSSLWEDEVFGHVRGAFTDARSDRQGQIDEAKDGTIFFDEIGEMPLEIQAKMLRLLQERSYTPIGSSKSKQARCRFIFATNRNLHRMVDENTFRPDLFYRVNVLSIQLPSLSQRKDDVPLLVRHFAEKISEELGPRIEFIEEGAMKLLINHSWPGNIRELENVLIRSIARCNTSTLAKSDISFAAAPQEYEGPGDPEDPADRELEGNFKELVNDFRMKLILVALERNNWNRAGAARQLGIKRTTLNSQIKELGI